MSYNIDERDFVDLPEPPRLSPRKRPDFLDDREKKYLIGLDKFINELGNHIRNIQEDVGKRMKKFSEELAKEQGNKRRGEDADQLARQEYNAQVGSVWRRRKQYREMVRDAIQERQRFLDSLMRQKAEEAHISHKVAALKALDDAQDLNIRETRDKSRFDLFSVVFLVLQIIIMLVYVVASKWGNTAPMREDLIADDSYTYLFNIALMVIFGFGFLLVFLRKFAFSGAAGNFLLVAFAVELGILTQCMWFNIKENPSSGWEAVTMTVPVLIDAFYVAAACSISYGSFAGKVSLMEGLVIVGLECFFYGLNHYVVIRELRVSDPGGAMTVHVFGSIFGLSASYFLSKGLNPNQLRPYVEEESNSSYYGEFMALVGTIFLWCLFPSFNAATAPAGTQHRVIVNTIVGLAGSTVFAFFASRTLRRKNFGMRELQGATLIGGVAMGSCHSLIIAPGEALLVGIVAGTISACAFVFFQPWMEKKSPFKTFDTRGAFNLHFIGGFIGGIASAIATGVDETKVFGQDAGDVFPRGLPKQGGYQAGGLAISFGIALGLGIITGFFIALGRRVSGTQGNRVPFSDKQEFNTPSDYPSEPAEGGAAEP